MKTCSACKVSLPLDDFPTRINNGAEAVIAKCKSCHKVYSIWQHMRQRCNNPKSKDYAIYGGRGISVCPAWSSFTRFFQDMGTRPPGTSIDRINNNQGYFPANCRWATSYEQATNTRRNQYIEAGGKRILLSEYSRQNGMARHTIPNRIRNGMPFDQAVSMPSRKGLVVTTEMIDGIVQMRQQGLLFKEIAKTLNISQSRAQRLYLKAHQ